MLEEPQSQLTEEATNVIRIYRITYERTIICKCGSIKNTLDRARMRQANRLFRTSEAQLTKANLTTIQAEDIRGSRLFINR